LHLHGGTLRIDTYAFALVIKSLVYGCALSQIGNVAWTPGQNHIVISPMVVVLRRVSWRQCMYAVLDWVC
jgi:hypothetical protein